MRFIAVLPGIFKIIRNEKPDLVVSTGAEIAIPVFVVAKLFHIETIYLESWCRIKEPSHTGRLVYPLSNIFLVQWKQLLRMYGKKAKYVGEVF
jgi:UDP-N-acetylglucosamine:LPS N-acetylglucosamine transferase